MIILNKYRFLLATTVRRFRE